MNSYKAVVFDLDGTLVDSLEDLAESMNIVLKNCNFPTHNLQSYTKFIGNGIRNLVRAALPDDNKDEVLINRCFDAMIDVYRENCTNKTKMYDGIADLLDELTSRKMKLAIFSNKADEFTKKIAEIILAKWKFESVVGLTIEAHKKPHPLVPSMIAQKMGLKPEEIIYVGDSGVDMQTAYNAGMYPVGALWGFRPESELVSNGAKYLLKHPLDLIKLL